MATPIRPQLSKNNKYWIEKHRYYELKHFCLQYPIWKKAYNALDGVSGNGSFLSIVSKTNTRIDPVAKCVEAKMYYLDRMNLVNNAAKEADEALAEYIVVAVTEGLTYTYLSMKMDIPCSRDYYYEVYRRFFWLLSKARD